MKRVKGLVNIMNEANALRLQKINQMKENRRKALRIKWTIILLSMIALISFIVFYNHIQAQADGVEHMHYIKCFKSVCVGYDETLEQLAYDHVDPVFYSSYQEYIDEIVAINSLDSENVRPGNYIIIPYYQISE